MKKIEIIVLVCSILFMGTTCNKEKNDCHNTITFNSESNDTLYVISSYLYPDTASFIGLHNPALDPNHTKVFPKESNKRVLWGSDCVELDFQDLIPSDTLMVYVFDGDVIENNSWDTVKSKYLVLIRYNLSLQDIKNMNWTITFP